ncbi:MAG: RNA-binding protein [Thaumarchaeota archaeon]|jgi:DNA-binding protein|nr:RNA-binding protein [Nitrososphaerota archaeon]
MSGEKPASNNIIFIGQKPLMIYVASAFSSLLRRGEVVVKARGKYVSKAVDVAVFVTKRFGFNNYEVKSIKTDTEQVGSGEQTRYVSAIEIKLSKKS